MTAISMEFRFRANPIHETASQSEIELNSIDSSYDSLSQTYFERNVDQDVRWRCFSGGLGWTGVEWIGGGVEGWPALAIRFVS